MRPGRLLALLVVVGSLVGGGTPVDAPQVCALALALGALWPICPWRLATRGLAAGVVVCLATAYAAHVRTVEQASPLLGWWQSVRAQPSGPVPLEGVLLEDAEVGPAGQVRLLVRVARIQSGGSWQDSEGRVQLTVSGGAAAGLSGEWTRGRRVRLSATLRQPTSPRNPGGSDPQWQATVRRLDLLGSVKSGALVRVAPGSWVDERATDVRRHVRRSVREAFGGVDDHAAAIVAAILLGDRAGLDPETVRRLQDAGTYHVVAISGGNVAVVVTAVLLVLRVVVRRARWLAFMALATVAGYWWIVGGEPSVDRAVGMAVVYLAAHIAGWVVAPLDTLAVAVLGLLVVDPLVALSPGAWLSCGATLGIIVGAGRLARGLGAGSATHPTWRSHVHRWAVTLFSATVAAELTLLPIMAFAFNRIGVAGLALNFVAIPAMAVVQIGGLLVVAASAVPAVATVALWPTVWASRALLGSSALVDAWPWLSWHVPSPSLVTIGLFYGCAVACLGATRPGIRRTAGGGVAATLLVIILAPGLEWNRPAPGWLRLTVFDVGQGDAMLLQFPSGDALMVDGGPASPTFDAGERLVVPGLWASGVRRLSWLAFSHADLDHIGGLASVARVFDPAEVWEGVPVPRDEKRARLRQSALRDARLWRQLRLGEVLDVGEASLEVLNPPVPDWERQRVRNDDSLVLRVRYGDAELLLTGDIGEAVEGALTIDDGVPRPLRVLKVAHHGSRTSSSAAFLQRYAPVAAVVSVGQNNGFGHPAAEVLARLAVDRRPVFRTDRDGAVIVETDGRVLRVRTWTGRAWTVRVAPVAP